MDKINTLKTFFLISAILNSITFVVWAFYTIFSGLVICGLGCIFGFLPAVSLVACIMDYIAYGKLNTQNKIGTYSSTRFAAIWDIISILTGNIVSMVFGIISLGYINDPEVRKYLTEKSIY